MSNPSKAFKQAVQKRNVFVQSITACYRFSQMATTDLQSKEQFNVRYMDLEENYEKFSKCHNAVIMEVPEDSDAEYSEQDKIRSDVQGFYYACKIVHNQLVPQNTSTGGQHVSPDPIPHLKELGIPIFRGDRKLWPMFFDLFNNIIHQNTNISDVRKLQHLLSYLEGEPLRLLSGIQISDDNYKIAYDKLVNRYQNKRLIANNALGLIMKATLKNDSAKELRSLVDIFSESLEVLKALSFDVDSWDYLLCFILIEKLDVSTRTSFEMINQVEIPTYQSLYQFLENKCKALESLQHLQPLKPKNTYQSNNNQFSKNHNKPTPPFSALVNTESAKNSRIKCFQCGQAHVLTKCPKFLELTPSERLIFIKRQKLCISCMHPSHGVDSCTSKYSCRTCSSKRHHSLLHISGTNQPEIASEDTSNNQTNQQSSFHVSFSGNASSTFSNTFLLATAMVDILDGFGNYQPVRIILDSGSQTSFISENCLRRLNLPRRQFSTEIYGLNQMTSFTSKGLSQCHIKPQGQSEPLLSFEAIVVAKLCSNMPSFSLAKRNWEHVDNLQLADPTYFKSNPVDLIVGCEIFAQVLKEGRAIGTQGQPTAIETIFGWVLLGKIDNSVSLPLTSSFFTNFQVPLEVILPKFWELENIPSKPLVSPEDQKAENKFCKSVSRLPSGRFMVDLPFKDSEPDLGNTYPQSLRRFLLLENRLTKNPQLYSDYSDFMKDYVNTNHMSLVLPTSPKPPLTCYLPHHCVLKPDSVSTKLRVVWDCSAKGPKNISLNQTLLSGPKLQKDIVSLLLTFRLNPIAYITDIKMMFRQVLISPNHRPFQRILWRFSSQDPISEYELNTVTFGMTCSPFLAMRTLNELADREQERFPKASKIVKSSIYIDDILGTSSSISEALATQKELINLFRSGGLELKKWASNCPELLAALPDSDRQMSLSFDKEEPHFIKILGLQWQPKSDIFTYQCQMKEKPWTKRSILSIIGTIFDPLGFLCPILLQAKFIMQQLWTSNLGWDETPPHSIVDSWSSLHSEFPLLSTFKLPRQIVLSKNKSCQIHAFSDASMRGYAAVVYFRVEEENHLSLSLICAKARVAPIKTQSVPRLELLGAVLLTDLVQFILATYSDNILFTDIYAWCDSQIVLYWLASCPTRLKTFVANRVNHIQEIIPSTSWHYIPSAQNAADAASRGMTPSQLISHDMWWNAPSFLWLPQAEWPNFLSAQPPLDFENLDLEEKQTVLNTIVDPNFLDILINKFSLLPKIQRILSYVIRITTAFLTHSFQKPTTLSNLQLLEKIENPTLDEMNNSLLFLIRHVQNSHFSELISTLSNNKPIPKPFRKLTPFLDLKGLIRVGGRLQRSEILSYAAKHPLLLPSKHRLTTLIIEHAHRKHLHPGQKTLHHLLLQQYWILSCRNAIQRTLSKCLKCFRVKPKPCPPPIMGSLPFHRINQLKPFSHVAIDFCGPFLVLPHRFRGCKSFKSYVCVFVCTSVRCVHLELTMDLSTEGFIAAFRRFVARRGNVTDCWSDQGSNFIGFHNQLLENAKEAANQLLIRWHLGPPLSPHFNGLAEAGVKSFKSHFVRVVGEQKLTIEEMCTLTCQIEAVLNSRPLTAQSSDPNDLLPLTPGHFLTLEPLNSGTPDPDLSHLPVNRLSRWQLIQRLHADFWKRYALEYLNTLQQRFKWSNPSPEIRVNDLVLVSSDNVKSPLKWPLGRVTELHPGEDGHVRVASVKMANGIYKRPAVSLAKGKSICLILRLLSLSASVGVI